MTNFTSTAKRIGKKIAYTVFADGVEIGSRTTGRSGGFKFAVVVRRNYAWAERRAQESLSYQTKELAECEANWVGNVKLNIEKLQARIAALASMTQDSPEFTAWTVYAFSNTGKDTPREWHYAMQLVSLNQPQA